MQIINDQLCDVCCAKKDHTLYLNIGLAGNGCGICRPCLEKALALFPKEEKWGCFFNIREDKPYETCVMTCLMRRRHGKIKETCGYRRRGGLRRWI